MTGEDKSGTASEASAPKLLRPLPDRPQDQTEDFHGHLMDLMVSVGAELPEVIRHEDVLDGDTDAVTRSASECCPTNGQHSHQLMGGVG